MGAPHTKFPLLGLMFLAACSTQVSFKQGAGADAFGAADRECRTPRKNYDQCMQAAGWSVHMNDLRLNPLSVPVLTDNRTPGVLGSTAIPAETVQKDGKGNPMPPDPMTLFNVAAWGKMGAGAGDLNADTSRCVAELGPAHAPKPDSPTMTRALILCLKDKGWSGLQGY